MFPSHYFSRIISFLLHVFFNDSDMAMNAVKEITTQNCVWNLLELVLN